MVICTMVHSLFHLDRQHLVQPTILPYFPCCQAFSEMVLLVKSFFKLFFLSEKSDEILLNYLFISNTNTSCYTLLFSILCFINFLFEFYLLFYFHADVSELAKNVCLKNKFCRKILLFNLFLFLK